MYLRNKTYLLRDFFLNVHLKKTTKRQVFNCDLNKIGRASCRERSVDLGGRRIIKKKK